MKKAFFPILLLVFSLALFGCVTQDRTSSVPSALPSIIPPATPSAIPLPASRFAPSLNPPAVSLPAPDLSKWLESNPRIASAIKWQYVPASYSDAYSFPSEESKIAWSNWSKQQKNDLNAAYQEAYNWFASGAPEVSPTDSQGLTDQPINVNPSIDSNKSAANTAVSPEYMWNLYVASVGFSLAEEIANQGPSSILNYSDEGLRYLLDSSTMAQNVLGQFYSFGNYASRTPKSRGDNLPETNFGPPFWTYYFLKSNGLIGKSRIETIGNVLEWMRQNLLHFGGGLNFETTEAVWQYRGYAPLSKIVSGTIDSNYPSYGKQHWIAGCHGSVGFLAATMRAANIPLQPVWVCGHELAYFISEGKYLDHGDDPYNRDVKNSSAPILSLLIDEKTYAEWFSPNAGENIVDYDSSACKNIGRSASEESEVSLG